MNYTKRMSAVKVILFALIFVGMSSRSSSTICMKSNSHSYCHLEAVSITTNDEATNFVFPNGPGIAFYKSTILSPAKILFGRLPDYVKTVYIDISNVPKVYINQTIDKFKAFRSSVQEVIIDRTSTYKLTELMIVTNLLRSVPENISRLTNLVTLYLSENKIETVTMGHFKDLTNLKVISLRGNSIVRVDTASPLNLPMLEILYLYNNKIQYLSITFWNFPNLHTFDVERNKLRSIMNFPRRFPKLSNIDVRKNQWSCAWLETIKSEMSKISKSSESCSGKSVEKICCQDYSIDDTSFNSFEERMTFEILQVSENLQEAIQQINYKNSKQTTDTRVLIDTKMSDVGRTVQKNTDEVKSTESNVRKLLQEMQKINTKLDENRASILDDQKKFQQEIVQIRESISKMNTDIRMLIDNKISDIGRTIQGIQQDVKSVESNIKKEVHQELMKIKEKVLENQVFILDDRKQLQQTSEKLQKGIDSIGERVSNLTTDTKVLIDSKWSDVSRTIQGIEEKVKSMESSFMKQVKELQKTNADDRKQLQQSNTNLQKEIEKIGASVSKQSNEIQEEVKTMESNIKKEVLQELTKINEKVLENQVFILDHRKQFQQSKTNLQKDIDKIGESISKMTTDIRELIGSQISNMTQTVKEITVEKNQEIQQMSMRVDEHRAFIVDDRKQLEEKINKQVEELQAVDVKFSDDQKRLEEKINNADNQNKEEFKWVKQKLNENRALIDDVVDDLYLAELEKQDL